MSYMKRLIEDIIADYESDVFTIEQIAEKNGVTENFVLHALESYYPGFLD